MLLRERPAEGRQPFDLPGFVLVAGGLTAVLYALSNADSAGWGSPSVFGMLLGGLGLLAVFAVVELRAALLGGSDKNLRSPQRRSRRQ